MEQLLPVTGLPWRWYLTWTDRVGRHIQAYGENRLAYRTMMAPSRAPRFLVDLPENLGCVRLCGPNHQSQEPANLSPGFSVLYCTASDRVLVVDDLSLILSVIANAHLHDDFSAFPLSLMLRRRRRGRYPSSSLR